jgi:hypothetical protein
MNGLLPDGHYFTIHITPEPDFSYVSFETNVPYNQYYDIIRKVINMFNPGKFTTTIFGGTVKMNFDKKFFINLFPLLSRRQQVWIVIVNYFPIWNMLVLIIKLFVWLIMILFIVIIKNIRAEDYATPSACVEMTCTHDRVLHLK